MNVLTMCLIFIKEWTDENVKTSSIRNSIKKKYKKVLDKMTKIVSRVVEPAEKNDGGLAYADQGLSALAV
jgi:hypothetical protein